MLSFDISKERKECHESVHRCKQATRGVQTEGGKEAGLAGGLMIVVVTYQDGVGNEWKEAKLKAQCHGKYEEGFRKAQMGVSQVKCSGN